MAIQNTLPADPRLGIALLDDTQRLLRWARAWLAEFAAHARHARVDDTERTAHAFVAALARANETLLDASWHLGARQIRDELLELRRTDPLLAYLWKAGQDTVTGRLVRWDKRADATEVVVVDPRRTLAWSLLRDPMFPGREREFLFRYLYGVDSRDALAQRVAADPSPLPGREQAAGVQVLFGLDTVLLQDFETRDMQGHVARVAAPARHLGAALERAAHTGLDKALAFYELRSERMRSAARKPAAGALSSAARR